MYLTSNCLVFCVSSVAGRILKKRRGFLLANHPTKNDDWLVVWNMAFMTFHISIYWEFHHPNWRTHIFQRGRSTTNQKSILKAFDFARWNLTLLPRLEANPFHSSFRQGNYPIKDTACCWVISKKSLRTGTLPSSINVLLNMVIYYCHCTSMYDQHNHSCWFNLLLNMVISIVMWVYQRDPEGMNLSIRDAAAADDDDDDAPISFEMENMWYLSSKRCIWYIQLLICWWRAFVSWDDHTSYKEAMDEWWHRYEAVVWFFQGEPVEPPQLQAMPGTHTDIYIYIYTHCIWMRMCICISICINVYIYINTHTCQFSTHLCGFLQRVTGASDAPVVEGLFLLGWRYSEGRSKMDILS